MLRVNLSINFLNSFVYTVNFKNVWFLVLLLVVLGISFGVVRVIGSFDSSSMYTQLVYGDN